MLQRADITGARPLILIEATAPTSALGDPKQEAFDRLNQLALGKEFQAQVLSRLANGSYLIQIEETVANVKLPPGTQSGDVLDLTLLTTQPRPTFLLGKADAGATTSLSNTGRLIGNLLQLAKQDGAAPTSVIGKTPLLAGPHTPAAQIAQAMKNAMTFSGLFYESHVAQWANGTRLLTDLQSEPPAKRMENTLPGTATAKDGGAPQHGLSSAGLRTTDLGKLVANMREWIGGAQRADAANTETARTLNVLKEHTLAAFGQDSRDTSTRITDTSASEGVKLISLQLDTLEQRRILWQGELFPGQPLEWEVSDETPQRKNNDEPAAEPSWQSSVRFSLPTLGAVSATIRLTGEHVQVNVRTADADTASALRQHGNLLADALGAAGTTLDALLVKHEVEARDNGQQTNAPAMDERNG